MNIKDDKTKIDLSPVDAVGGAKPEPEERPAERVLTVDRSSIDLKMSTGGVFTYDKLKVMLDVSLSAAADCERCRKIQKQEK